MGVLERLKPPTKSWKALQIGVLGLMMLGIVIVSHSMVDYSLEPHRLCGDWMRRSIVYPSELLHPLEFIEVQPNIDMSFWLSANRSVDIYVMSHEQYLAQKSQNKPPKQYFWHFQGKEGNITIVSNAEIGVQNYHFTIYTGEKSILIYEHGLYATTCKAVKKLNPALMIINIPLIISTVFLINRVRRTNP